MVNKKKQVVNIFCFSFDFIMCLTVTESCLLFSNIFTLKKVILMKLIYSFSYF